MVKRTNPYTLGPNITVDLRDSRGRYASPSKAKYFTFYIDGEIALADEFEKVSTPVSEKWELINLYLQELLDIAPPQVVEPEVVEEEEIIEEPEELTKEDRDELTELLYKDLLEILEIDEPDIYASEVGLLLDARERIEQKEVVSDEWGEIAIFKYFYSLITPYKMVNPTGEELVWFFRRYLEEPLKAAYESMPESIEDMYLFRMTYDIKAKGGWNKEGIGPRRIEAPTWEILRDEIYNVLFDMIFVDMRKYIEASFEQTIRMTGFTLETIWEEL